MIGNGSHNIYIELWTKNVYVFPAPLSLYVLDVGISSSSLIEVNLKQACLSLSPKHRLSRESEVLLTESSENKK